eukprot:TRINITY_DN3258_c0_g1_i3.p1 TRINITY_DN3258_c0_g1~~TRINITY_DN3258_c0_g1_i3.p1  ORF type:complete len:243 (-),score=23.83 TRINITY_DN3258_c0_g1_i3:33-761(-)
MLDVMDVVALLSDQCPDVFSFLFESTLELERRGFSFLSKPLSEAVNFSRQNRIHFINSHAQALYAMVLLSQKVKRICVSDRKNEISAVLSQSSVISFLSSHADKLGRLGDMTADDLLSWSGRKPLKSVNYMWPLLKAFNMLHQNTISSAPVLDDDGHLVGMIRSRDIKLLTPEKFSMLSATVREFQAVFPASAPVKCNVDTLLPTIIRTLATLHEHIALVMQAEQPVGVISLRDLLEVALAT